MSQVKEVRTPGADRAAPAAVVRPGIGTQEMVELVATLAITALPRHSAVSFTLLSGAGGLPVTVVSTTDAARDLDAVQYESGAGPCLEAIEVGRDIRAVLASGRWPDLAAAAVPLGFRAVWSIPLIRSGPAMGSMNIYAAGGEPWQGNAAATVRVAAALTALGLSCARGSEELARGNETLREALDTRTVIGQAQGVLMAREDIDAAAAFDILRRASQRTNRKLRDIAGEMVAGFGRPPAPGGEA